MTDDETLYQDDTLFQVDLHDLVMALSEALGLVGGKIVDHGKRVAFIALRVARELAVDRAEFDDLRTAALLHDAGVSCTKVHEKLLQFDWEGAESHCRDGALLLKGFRHFGRVADIIALHHHKWSDLQNSGVDPRTAILANLIFMADRIDVLIDWTREVILSRERIEARVKELAGNFFNPEAVRVFLRQSEIEVFWLSLLPRHLPRALTQYKPNRPLILSLSEIESLAAIFARIVDNKSRYTRDHSDGVARLCRFFGSRMGLDPVTVKKLGIAGLVHDLGKLAIPDDILEKPAPLTADEFQIVKRHPFETHYILSTLPELADVRDWASFHHEKWDGSGYPFHLTQQDYRIEHVIVMLADVIQALIQDRPYRPGLSEHQVLDILTYISRKQELLEPLVRVVNEEYGLVAAVANGREKA